MGTLYISLPDSMKEFVDQQVAQRGYRTSGAYVRELIRREQDSPHLRHLLLEAAESPVTGAGDDKYFASLRARVRSLRRKRSSVRPRRR